MVAPLLLWLFAVTVRRDHTPLRSGCGDDERVVAHLAAGTRVEIRFAIADGSGCYKVQAGELAGYVAGQDLAGLDEFDRQRRAGGRVSEAASPTPITVPTQAPALRKNIAVHTTDPQLARASQLIDANQPREALDLLAPELREHNPDPNALMLAGLAAYKSDDVRGAIDYWRQSLTEKPNPQLEAWYEQVERERKADDSSDKLYGYRFQLRYEGTSVPADVARAMLPVLDEEFTRISAELGCPSNDRIPVIVQSREAYLRTTGAAEWSGGQYDGRIHVALVEGNAIGPETRRVFAHEIVHACLANLGRWPSWLHEGLAQKLSGDVLSETSQSELKELIQRHAAPKLENLTDGWSHMDAARARVAYHLALAAADALYDNYAAYGITNLLRNPDRLPQVTVELDRKLGL
jgi:tetratricopeptide (TPR) repeat protein